MLPVLHQDEAVAAADLQPPGGCWLQAGPGLVSQRASRCCNKSDLQDAFPPGTPVFTRARSLTVSGFLLHGRDFLFRLEEVQAILVAALRRLRLDRLEA